jgi:predicted RNase H-like HicB family nuclease
MQNQYTALVKKDGDWWIGWIEEIPGVNCQEKSHEDLLQSLRETLREAIEFNRMDAIEAAGIGYKEETFAI